MQDTRQQILEILKRQGEVTVQQLSQELTLTSVTVRHHLEILRSEGYVTEPQVEHSNHPGRPRYTYRLTSTAADLFPNNYSGLASALLECLDEQMPPEAREALLEATARRLAAGAGVIPERHEACLETVVAFLNRQGFVARWEKVAANVYCIHISNCPYHYVTRVHPQTCHIDERMIHALTGGELVRTCGYACQDALCSYQITWPVPS